MVSTMKQLTADKVRLAHCALEGHQAGPDLPIDVLPLDVFLVIHKLDETVQVEESVSNMLSDYLPMEVNKYLGICAHHPLVLLARVQLPTIYASVQQSGSLVLPIALISCGRAPTAAKKCLQFLHEQFAGEFISLVNEVIQTLNCDLISDAFN